MEMTKSAAHEAAVEAKNDAMEAEASPGPRAALLLVPAPPTNAGTAHAPVLAPLAIDAEIAGMVTVDATAGTVTVEAVLARPANNNGGLGTGSVTIAVLITLPLATRASSAGSLSVLEREMEELVVVVDTAQEVVAEGMTVLAVATRGAVVAVAMTGATTEEVTTGPVVGMTVGMVVVIEVGVSTAEVAATVTGVVAVTEVVAIATVAIAMVAVVAVVVAVAMTAPLARVLHSSQVTGTARGAGGITLLQRLHAIAAVLPVPKCLGCCAAHYVV